MKKGKDKKENYKYLDSSYLEHMRVSSAQEVCLSA